MNNVVTVSSKIPQSWIQLITAKGKPSAIVRLALAQYLGVSEKTEVNHEDIQKVNPLRSDIVVMQARLDDLEKFVGYTKVNPKSEKGIPKSEESILKTRKGIPDNLPSVQKEPIAAVTIGSPAIITESLVQPELQPSNEVENNPIMTRAKDEAQSQTELQPIGIDQDATTPNFLGTGELFRRIAARGYGKSIRTFRSDLAKAAQVRQLPDDLIKLGVHADWNQRESKPSHSSSNRWLWIAPLG